MKFLSNLDLAKNELLNLRLQNLASAPGSPVEGQLFHDSTAHAPFVWDGTAWVNILASGGAVAFADVTGKPTTLAGYGITDAFDGVFASLSSRPTTLAGYGITDAVASSLLGASSGVATLDSGGKVAAGQLPSITISDTFVVATEAAMLALAADVGDVAVRTDLNKSFILKTAGATVLANWQELLTPTSAVQSVNGETGAVVLDLFDGAYASLTGAPDLGLLAPLLGPAFTDYVDVGSGAVADAGLSLTATDGVGISLSGVGGSTTANISAVDVTSLSISVQKPDVTPGPLSVSASEVNLTGNTQQIRLKLNGALGTLGQVPTSDAAGAVTWATPAGTVSKYSTTVGDGAATSIAVTHSLNSRDVVVGISEAATPWNVVQADVQKTTLDSVTLLFAVAPAANSLRVTVIG